MIIDVASRHRWLKRMLPNRLGRAALMAVLGVLWLSTAVVQAANLPCSGRKGGIAGCQGDTFLCNDGSVSASKKSCSAYMGGAVGLLGGTATQMSPAIAEECTCRSGTYCTGPRGGRYCMIDSGAKSYLRK
jgi:hypothetical protein